MTTPKQNYSFKVNGKEYSVEAFSMERLLDVLRHQCQLTGCKEGCGEGECGSCSVLLNGQLVNSCLIPITQVQGAEILTVEGLAAEPIGQKLQNAFVQHGGAQCGICTPGMLLASYNLLRDNPKPSLEEIKVGLAGNLCRCTGYMKIFDSVQAAAGEA